jgi:hypothetical protein
MNKQRIIVLVAAGVGLLSCFMTWATVGVSFFSMSVNGVQSGWGGKIALLGFILAIVFALLGDRNQPIEKDKKKFVMIGGIVALVMTLLAMVGMSFQEGSSMVTFGIGIYISLLAGIALTAMPFVIKDSGDFEMPTKDALVDDLKEMKEDIVEDVKDVAHDVADKAKDLKEDVKDKFDGKDDKGE